MKNLWNEIEAQTKGTRASLEIRGPQCRKIPVTSELVSKTGKFINGTALCCSLKSTKHCKYQQLLSCNYNETADKQDWWILMYLHPQLWPLLLQLHLLHQPCSRHKRWWYIWCRFLDHAEPLFVVLWHPAFLLSYC